MLQSKPTHTLMQKRRALVGRAVDPGYSAALIGADGQVHEDRVVFVFEVGEKSSPVLSHENRIEIGPIEVAIADSDIDAWRNIVIQSGAELEGKSIRFLIGRIPVKQTQISCFGEGCGCFEL